MPPKADHSADHSADHNVSGHGANDSDEGMMSATGAAPAVQTGAASENKRSRRRHRWVSGFPTPAYSVIRLSTTQLAVVISQMAQSASQ